MPLKEKETRQKGTGMALLQSLAELCKGELYLGIPSDGMNTFILEITTTDGVTQ